MRGIELLGAIGIGAVTEEIHDEQIYNRRGWLQALIQQRGVTQISTTPCDTIVFGNTQIITWIEEGSTTNLKMLLRLYRDGAWHSKDII